MSKQPPDRTRSVRANGIDSAYDSFGDEDHPAILLISGLGTQMIRWTEAFRAALAARGIRVIGYDCRDAGLSRHLDAVPAPDFGRLAATFMSGQRPDVPYTLGDLPADAVPLLESLAIGRAHVVGRSMGDMVAQILASDFPDRVHSPTSIMASTGNPALPPSAPGRHGIDDRPKARPL